MKKLIFTLALLVLSTTAGIAQNNNNDNKGRKHFSHEEFQAKQRAFIVEKAKLTPEEADAFFPLYFELQKKKFEIEHGVRKSIGLKRKEKPTEEQCRQFVNKMAEVKVEIAKLEQDYVEKYLEVISPCRVLEIQHAADQFQRHLMKEMMQHRDKRNKPNEKR